MSEAVWITPAINLWKLFLLIPPILLIYLFLWPLIQQCMWCESLACFLTLDPCNLSLGDFCSDIHHDCGAWGYFLFNIPSNTSTAVAGNDNTLMGPTMLFSKRKTAEIINVTRYASCKCHKPTSRQMPRNWTSNFFPFTFSLNSLEHFKI